MHMIHANKHTHTPLIYAWAYGPKNDHRQFEGDAAGFGRKIHGSSSQSLFRQLLNDNANSALKKPCINP